MENTARLKIHLAQQENELQNLRRQLKLAKDTEKSQEKALADSKREVKRLEILHTLSYEVIFVLNEAGLCRQVTPSLVRQLGYLTREVVGIKLLNLVHADDRAALEKVFQTSLTQPDDSLPPVEFRFRHKDGSWRFFEAGVTNLLTDPNMGGIVICGGDITERKQLEEKISATGQFLLDFDEELRSLTGEQAVWETAIRRLEADFENTRIYFAELGENEDEEQLLLQPPAVHHAFFSGAGKGNSQILNTMTGLLVEAVESSQPLSGLVGKIPAPGNLPPPDTTVRSMLLVPLFKDERLLAAMILESVEGSRMWSSDDMALLQTVLQRLWLSVQNVRLFRRGQQTAVLEERMRLARDLHDSIQQNLYGIELNISTALTLLGNISSPAGHPMKLALDYSRASRTELHSLVFNLRPESLRSQGLVADLQSQLAAIEKNNNIAVKSNLGDEPQASLETKETLYWIGREALNNVVKHSRANLLELNLDWASQPGFIHLTIKDNGRGFDPDDTFPGHLGLQSMRERVARLGGVFSIESAPEKGTVVQARLPSNKD